MRRGTLCILSVLALAVLAATSNQALGDEQKVTIPEVTEAHRAAFAKVKVIRLVLEEECDKKGETFEVGVRKAITELLEMAGFKVVTDGEADAELLVKVSARPLFESYSNSRFGEGDIHYSGGKAAASAKLAMKGLPPVEASSEEASLCPRVISTGAYTHVQHSPAWALATECSRRSVLALLLALDPQACTRVLTQGSVDVRYPAARALRKIGPGAEAAVPALIRALKDQDSDVRWSAAWALGEIGPAAEAAVPGLIEALKDEGWGVRMTAAGAVGKIGPGAQAAVPALIEALKDEVSSVRKGAAKALGKIGPAAEEAVPALEELLQDEDSGLRNAARQALKKIRRD